MRYHSAESITAVVGMPPLSRAAEANANVGCTIFARLKGSTAAMG